MSGFSSLFDFEQALADFTGSPYVVVTDCCTHAIELCLRYQKVNQTSFTAFTYLSVPMIMRRLGIAYKHTEEPWVGEYQFHGTTIWDSARRLERNMYRAGQMQCVSFGVSKPLHLGRGGAILLDDPNAYHALSQWRSDGRDLHISPWQSQTHYTQGWHYCPTLELCEQGIDCLKYFAGAVTHHTYPDCRKLTIL
jgi:dTDP-4-amino-4,6-dideoxygalactose transaminase